MSSFRVCVSDARWPRGCDTPPLAGQVPSIAATCEGRPRDMGRILGEVLADRIHMAEQTLRAFRAFRLHQPWWLPYPFFQFFAEVCPAALRGRRVLRSPERRDARMTRLLREVETINTDSLARLMGDHGSEGLPSDETICMHGGHWSTLVALQLLPKWRTMRVSYGPACQAQFVDFAL
ncbi:MAG: hypothetical protein ACOY3P_06425 [Planctomycetota bacterium]